MRITGVETIVVRTPDGTRGGKLWTFVKLMTERGYDGYYSLEWEKMWHPEIEEPEVAFPQYVEYMRKLQS